MNAPMATTDDLITDDRIDTLRGSDTKQAPSTPTLASTIKAICLDANYDSLRFVLRSDTGHDGE